MRPERLLVEGLTVFRDRQEIDFRELDVFAITGPTGAGKTSIFDAISLALYGRIPRVGTSAQVRRFISHGASEAVVQLEFLVDDVSYGVVRRYRTDSSVSVATLERLDGADGPLELESGQRAVTARITELIGMDYDAFQRAVLLPQGQFDLFLTGDPSERRAVLIRLLDLERYVEAGRLAREQARDIAATVAAQDSRLDALEHATSATHEQRTRARDAAVRERTALAEQVRQARAEQVERERATELARQLELDADAWLALSERVERLEGDARAARGLGSTREAEAADSRAEFARAEERLAERERERAAVLERVGTAEQHAAAENEIKSRRRALARVDARKDELVRTRADESSARKTFVAAAGEVGRARDALERRIRDARGRCEASTVALAKARSARTEAEREHEALVRRHLAAGLRSQVHVGEGCPVCDQPIERAPSADVEAETDLDTERRVLDEARTSETQAIAALSESEREITRLETEHDRTIDELDGIRGLIGDDPVPAPAGEAAGVGEPGRDALRAARSDLERARSVREGAEQRLSDAEEELVEVEARLRGILGTDALAEPDADLARRRSELAASEDALGTARVAVGAARERRDDALGGLSRHAEADRERQRVLGELRGRADALLSRARADAAWPELAPLAWPSTVERLDPGLTQELHVRCEVLRGAAGVAVENARAAQRRIAGLARLDGAPSGRHDPLQTLSAAHEAAIAATAEAERELARLEDEIRERAEIERSRAAGRRRAERLEWIASHLRDDSSGFLAYVISESLDTLCELASARLEQMSERRYTLHADADGSFQVVDAANAGERRDVETLSGGETFLVSFALALALSESITNYGSGRGALLEAIFIDEGFSALDSDSLEVALDALETIGHAEQRMIGLVSHVERVPERIPEGIDVIKGAGSSRVRRRGTAPVTV